MHRILHVKRWSLPSRAWLPEQVRSHATAAQASKKPLQVGKKPKHGLKQGDVIGLECVHLGHSGKGLCLYGESQLVVLCHDAIPGELVQARITKVRVASVPR